jgi:predicted dehydrogenase
MTKKTVSRRNFLQIAALGTGIEAGLPQIVTAAERTSPNDRINVGCIGSGNRGRSVMNGALTLDDAQVVAVCDTKSTARDEAVKMVNQRYENRDCDAYATHEELLARDDLDAIIVGSCDHWHVLHSIAAMRAGKSVYMEKPVGVTIEEGQALRKAVRETGQTFQLGTQQRSDRRFWQACTLARNERIGKLKSIRVWAPPSITGGPTEEAPVPDYLDYDRWLGPAQEVPYTKDRDSNEWWWHITDYALGFIAGWGIHPMDIALWGAGDLTRTPVTVEGTGVFSTEGVCNAAIEWDVHLRYDSGVDMHFISDPPPDEWKQQYAKTTGHGTVFEGADGWVLVDRNHIEASSPEILEQKLGPDAEQLYRSDHHVADWITATREKRDPVSVIEDSVEADFACHISDIAIRLEKPLKWNPKTETFDDAEANARLTRPMRAPWKL